MTENKDQKNYFFCIFFLYLITSSKYYQSKLNRYSHDWTYSNSKILPPEKIWFMPLMSLT